MKNAAITTFLQARIENGDFPSAVYLVAEKGRVVFEDALGYAVLDPQKIAAKPETIYDLASLTKPLVTGLLFAKLLEDQRIGLEDKASKYLPGFETTDKQSITILQLLAHTSGLPAWIPFYLMGNCAGRAPDCFLKEIANVPLASPPGEKASYSDVNFIALTFLLERIYKKRIDKIAKLGIFAPLKLKDTFYNPPENLKDRIAANENGNWFEFELARQFGYNFNLNTYAERKAWGAAHDANTFFMEGISGHAGLFSTARETFKIALQFLPGSSQLLKPATCGLFRNNFTQGLNESRSLSFELAETPGSTASEALAKDSFGHLGFTGTSLWIDPESERIFILLTNRTHAHALPFVNINSIRRQFHSIACEEMRKL